MADIISFPISSRPERVIEEDESVDGDVIHVGVCVQCQRIGRILYHACPDCRKVLGLKGGIISKKIREDAEFASSCYSVLPDDRKLTFIKIFGLPEGCSEPYQTLSAGPSRLKLVT